MDEDIRNNLKSNDGLNNEAIEKFTALQNELSKHYAFAESAIPIDIFKPNLSKIENYGDAWEYFENSVDEYHKPENHLYLEELYSWLEDDYSSFLSDKECHKADYHHVIDFIYASKLLKLPYEHICNSFNLREEEEIGFGYHPGSLGDDPLTNFFYYFYEVWYQKGIDTNFKSNREETQRFYDLNRIRQNLT